MQRDSLRRFLDDFIRSEKPIEWPTTLRRNVFVPPHPTAVLQYRSKSTSLPRASSSSAPRRHRAPLADDWHRDSVAQYHRHSPHSGSRAPWNPSIRVPATLSSNDPLQAILRHNLIKSGFDRDYESAARRFRALREKERVKAIAEAEHEEAAALWWYCTNVMPFERQRELIHEESADRDELVEVELERRTLLAHSILSALDALHQEEWLVAESRRLDLEHQEASSFLERQQYETRFLKRIAAFARVEAEERIEVENACLDSYLLLCEAELSLRTDLVAAASERWNILARERAVVEDDERTSRRLLLSHQRQEMGHLISMLHSAWLAECNGAINDLSSREEDNRAELWALETRDRQAIEMRHLSIRRERAALSDVVALETKQRLAVVQTESAAAMELLQGLDYSAIEALQATEARERRHRCATADEAAEVMRRAWAQLALFHREDVKRGAMASEETSLRTSIEDSRDERAVLVRVASDVHALHQEELTRRSSFRQIQAQEFETKIALTAMRERQLIATAELSSVEERERTTRSQLLSAESHRVTLLLQMNDTIYLESQQRDEVVFLFTSFLDTTRQTMLTDRREVLLACEARLREDTVRAMETQFTGVALTMREARDTLIARLKKAQDALYQRGLASTKKFIGLTVVERLKEKILQVEALHVNGPSHAAGVLLGDTLSAVGGIAVRSREDMRKAIAQRGKVGEMLSLTLQRAVALQQADSTTPSPTSSSASSATFTETVNLQVRVLCTDEAFVGLDYYFDPRGPKLGHVTGE